MGRIARNKNHRGVFPVYGPTLVPTENVKFYCNFTTPVSEARTNWRMDLLDSKNQIDVVGIAALNEVAVTGGVRFRIDFTMPTPSGGNGYYRFMIWNTVSTEVKFISNPVRVTSQLCDIAYTSTVQYSSPNNIFNYDYEQDPQIETILRIEVNLTDTQFPDEQEEYKELSTGLKKRYSSELDKVYELETYYFDDAAHEAFAVMLQHEDLIMNDVPIVKDGDYSVETDTRQNVYRGRVTVIDNNFANINRGC